ncbi:MAG TPA: energy transducer TonB, partial [Pyrinomonadaceae bacterium]|nr:energy transducer TonB [Pyrinomonadaceae bacterium]
KQKYDDLTPEERVALRRQYAAGYKAASASVESYLQLNPKEADFWRAQAESLRFYAEESAKPEAEKTVFYSSDEGVAKAVISYKPEPLYTNEARNKGTTGTTIFRAVLDADGTVKHILALKTLPDGLTENSFAVMRQIRFTPATKDGRPVSQYVAIEYNFNIY